VAPIVTLYVHEINTVAHPATPPGWRWAVHIGGRGPADLDYCVNAGWGPDQQVAALTGEAVAVAAFKALRLCGLTPTSQTQVLDHDPIPAGADRIQFAIG